MSRVRVDLLFSVWLASSAPAVAAPDRTGSTQGFRQTWPHGQVCFLPLLLHSSAGGASSVLLRRQIDLGRAPARCCGQSVNSKCTRFGGRSGPGRCSPTAASRGPRAVQFSLGMSWSQAPPRYGLKREGREPHHSWMACLIRQVGTTRVLRNQPCGSWPRGVISDGESTSFSPHAARRRDGC